MDEAYIHNSFVKSLESKVSKKSKLAEFIAQTLFIEKESAYRRLRGEVQFSLREASLLASKLNISLDEIIGSEKRTMIMELPKDPPMGVNDDFHIRKAIDYLEELTCDPFSEFGVALSGITLSLFLPYDILTRFYILKYVHHAGNPQKSIPYEKIVISPKHKLLRYQYSFLFRKITNTYYIWDRKIIKNLVNDIIYAKSIRLITDKEVIDLKKELHHFLYDLEKLATKGVYEDTGNRFELYISDANIDVTYAYLWSEKRCVSMISSFIFLVTASQEKTAFKDVSEWIKSLKRFSTLVSSIGERDRILFFEEQHALIDQL